MRGGKSAGGTHCGREFRDFQGGRARADWDLCEIWESQKYGPGSVFPCAAPWCAVMITAGFRPEARREKDDRGDVQRAILRGDEAVPGRCARSHSPYRRAVGLVSPGGGPLCQRRGSGAEGPAAKTVTNWLRGRNTPNWTTFEPVLKYLERAGTGSKKVSALRKTFVKPGSQPATKPTTTIQVRILRSLNVPSGGWVWPSGCWNHRHAGETYLTRLTSASR